MKDFRSLDERMSEIKARLDYRLKRARERIEGKMPGKASLSVAALIELDEALSLFRHESINGSLYAVGLRFQNLESAPEDPRVLDGLDLRIKELESGLELLDSFSRRPMRSGGPSPGDFWVEETLEMRHCMENLLSILHCLLDAEDKDYRRELSKEGSRCLSEYQRVLDEMRRGLDTFRSDLADTVKGSVDSMDEMFRSQGIQVSLLVEPGAERRVFGSAELFRQMISEILTNAFRHAFDAGSGERRIDVSLEHPDGNRELIRLRISDNGKGIPKDRLDRVFEPGVSTGGTGEGLWHVKRMAKDLGGMAKVESSEGSGTSLLLLFPIKSAGSREITTSA